MLHLYKYKRNASAPETLHPRYIVRNVSFASNDSAGLNLRQKVLENTTSIEAGRYFALRICRRLIIISADSGLWDIQILVLWRFRIRDCLIVG